MKKLILGKTSMPLLAALLLMLPGMASAQELDSGDTAWMITATVLAVKARRGRSGVGRHIHS